MTTSEAVSRQSDQSSAPVLLAWKLAGQAVGLPVGQARTAPAAVAQGYGAIFVPIVLGTTIITSAIGAYIANQAKQIMDDYTAGSRGQAEAETAAVGAIADCVKSAREQGTPMEECQAIAGMLAQIGGAAKEAAQAVDPSAGKGAGDLILDWAKGNAGTIAAGVAITLAGALVLKAFR